MTTPAQDLQARFASMASAFQIIAAQLEGAAADFAALFPDSGAPTQLDFSSSTNSGLLAAIGAA